MDKNPEQIAIDFRTLAEENERKGKTTAAAVYRDAANHVEGHLVEEDDTE